MKSNNRRRSGRTHGVLLGALGKAIANPGEPAYYKDHAVNTYGAHKHLYLPWARELARTLNLKVAITVAREYRRDIGKSYQSCLKIVSTYKIPSNAVDFIKNC